VGEWWQAHGDSACVSVSCNARAPYAKRKKWCFAARVRLQEVTTSSPMRRFRAKRRRPRVVCGGMGLQTTVGHGAVVGHKGQMLPQRDIGSHQ